MSRSMQRVIKPWNRWELLHSLNSILTTDHQFQFLGILKWLDQVLNFLLGWIRRPTSIMIIATLISILCGLLINQRALLIACFLGFLVYLGRVLPSRLLQMADVKMIGSENRVTEGCTLTLHISSSSSSVWPVSGITIETGLDDATQNAITPHCIHLPYMWRSRQKYSIEYRSSRFGIYPSLPPLLRCSFPFQLCTAKRQFANDFNLIVNPQVYQVPEFPDFSTGVENVGTTLGNRKGNSGETISLRPFRQGDDPRRIHWPQTARTGSMVVREQQAAIRPSVMVHLGNSGDYHSWTLDWSVRLAASFIVTGLEQGWQCELLLGDLFSQQRLLRNCRSERFLDVLSAFGNDWDFINQNTEKSSSEVHADRLHLRIMTSQNDNQNIPGLQKIIMLGNPSPENSISSNIWKTFLNESDLRGWLSQKG